MHRLFRQREWSRLATSQSIHSSSFSISFVTDIEGDREYLERYVDVSKVLCWKDALPGQQYSRYIDFKNGDDHLVFGGDVWDQGGSDLYVIRQLLNLKKSFPCRVHFVLGNRDVNKMRLAKELEMTSDGQMRSTTGVYWLRGSGLVGDMERKEEVSRDPVKRMKWILKNTMGSPRAFGHRKSELEREGKEAGLAERVVDDMDVFRSYERTASPRGEMGEYLKKAAPFVRIGDALFVHGCLPLISDVLQHGQQSPWDDLSFAMPWIPHSERAQDYDVRTIDDWLNALTDFSKRNIASWSENPLQGDLPFSEVGGFDDPRTPSYSELLQYGMGWTPDRKRIPTVIYNGWNIDGMPRNFYPDSNSGFMKATSRFLLDTGISILCTGHQPQGDIPNAIAVPLSSRTAWLLACDTSYSGDVYHIQKDGSAIKSSRGTSRSGRGSLAVTEVILNSSGGAVQQAYMHGKRSTGEVYETEEFGFDSNAQVLPGVGVKASLQKACHESSSKSDWWARARLKKPRSSTILSSGSGYDSYFVEI